MQQLVLENNAPIELGGRQPKKALLLNFSREKKEKKKGERKTAHSPKLKVRTWGKAISLGVIHSSFTTAHYPSAESLQPWAWIRSQGNGNDDDEKFRILR